MRQSIIVLALLAFVAAQVHAVDQPNILVLWGDDIGTTNISANSNGMMGYRTANIDRIAREVEALVPEARIRVAHGQMRERELEQVMFDFYRQRFNVLVCTTIIESGIDIPQANTLVVERADALGEHVTQHRQVLDVVGWDVPLTKCRLVFLAGKVRRRGHDECNGPVRDNAHVASVAHMDLVELAMFAQCVVIADLRRSKPAVEVRRVVRFALTDAKR